ncbi:MAG: SIR2 family protein [Alphaproteobacteria bacterium]
MAASARGYAIVLGAGASRAAWRRTISAPLDKGFFSEAKRILYRKGVPQKHKEIWRSFSGAAAKAGIQPKKLERLGLEEVCTYLESRSNLKSLQIRKGQPKDYGVAIRKLKQLVCLVLSHSGATEPCELHENMLKECQTKSVITFNYDIIADTTLMKMGILALRDKEYCDLGVLLGTKTGKNKTIEREKLPKAKANSVRLYKMHGSINWTRNKQGRFYLSSRKDPRSEYEWAGAPKDPFIVAPVASKLDIKDSHFKDVWKNALKSLKEAKGWIIWGYSFPRTDTTAQVLFRVALQNNKKYKRVIVINPDLGMKGHVEALLDKVKVEQFTSAEQFLYHL